jgi:hypothetical protein
MKVTWREMFETLSVIAAMDLNPKAADPRVYDVLGETLKVAKACWHLTMTEELKFKDKLKLDPVINWEWLSARYGFELNDEKEDIEMCTRLTILDMAGLEP